MFSTVPYISWACGLRKVCKIVGDYFIGPTISWLILSLYVSSYLFYYCIFLSLLLTESLNLSHSFSMHTSFYISSVIEGVQLPSYSNSSKFLLYFKISPKYFWTCYSNCCIQYIIYRGLFMIYVIKDIYFLNKLVYFLIIMKFSSFYHLFSFFSNISLPWNIYSFINHILSYFLAELSVNKL